MSTLDASVELLERSLAYTRGTLADLLPEAEAAGRLPELLRRRTPCRGWDLALLLAHMDDGLDAFIEAASGFVAVDPLPAPDPSLGVVGLLRDKACTLLGAWAAQRPSPDLVRVGDLELAGTVLAATAALEITVHGWDVGRTTGRGRPIPAALAADLLGVATAVLDPADRPGRFAPPLPADAGAGDDERLLAFLGRPVPVQAGRHVA